MKKAMCINKNRDTKGRILSYTLQDKNGQMKEMTGQQIKQAISNKQLDILNLQIDKAGRLVDRVAKKVNKQEEALFTVEEMICMRQAEGRKIKIYKREDDKEYIGEVTGYCTNENFNEYLRNRIYVYVPQLGSRCLVEVTTKDSNTTSKYWKDLGQQEHDKWKESDYIDFYNRNKVEFKLTFVISKQYKADEKPNKNGLYTITSIGKYTDSNGEQHRIFKIRDNQTGKESWGSVDAHIGNNKFTNVEFKRERMIFDKNIPVVDVSEQYKKLSLLEKKIAEEIVTCLKNGGVTYSDGKVLYFDKDKKLQSEYSKLIFSDEENWDSFVTEILDRVIDRDNKVYYAYFGFDREELGVIYSYNKKDIEMYINTWKNEFEPNGVETELSTNI